MSKPCSEENDTIRVDCKSKRLCKIEVDNHSLQVDQERALVMDLLRDHGPSGCMQSSLHHLYDAEIKEG